MMKAKRRIYLARQASLAARQAAIDIYGTPISALSTSALEFWLAHFTAGTPVRAALLAEIDRRETR